MKEKEKGQKRKEKKGNNSLSYVYSADVYSADPI